MHYADYVPVYHHTRDLNVGGSDFSWNLINGYTNNGVERGHSVFPCATDQYLGYDKELMRQTVMYHEATFRHQVRELHRLHRRQMELMNEIRARELLNPHLQLQRSLTNHYFSRSWSGISHTSSHAASWNFGDLSDSKLSMLTSENIQRENVQESLLVTGPVLRGTSNDEVEALSSRSKGREKRIIDLELPPHFYHDDLKHFGEGKISGIPEVTSGTPKMLPHIQPASFSDCGIVERWDSSSSNLGSKKSNVLFDLNEPIRLESLTSSCNGFLETTTSPMAMPTEPESLGPEDCIPVNHGRSTNFPTSPVRIDLNSEPHSCFPQSKIIPGNCQAANKMTKFEDPKGECNIGNFCSDDEKLPDFGVECLSPKHPSKNRDSESADEVSQDCGSAHHHAMGEGKCNYVNPVSETAFDVKFSQINSFFDLNSCTDVEELSLPPSSTNKTKLSRATYFEAPVSPENKEGSPPRGKSDDSVLETPLLLSEQGGAKVDLDKIAAEILVSISCSEVKPFINGDCLCWLADIISSAGEDLENLVMKFQNRGLNDDPYEIVYDLAATMPKLADEDAMLVKQTGTVSRRSGRGNSRGSRKRKDLQSDLPSIASVSKNLDNVEGRNRTRSLRGNARRNTCTQLRDSSKLYPKDIVKKSINSILHQHATCSDQGILQGWGMKRKRQSGRVASNKFLSC